MAKIRVLPLRSKPIETSVSSAGEACSTEFEPSRTTSFFFFQAEGGIRFLYVTGVQTCALPICLLDNVVGGKRRHTESLPQRRPEHALIADVAFENDQHLAESLREHVDVADG